MRTPTSLKKKNPYLKTVLIIVAVVLVAAAGVAFAVMKNQETTTQNTTDTSSDESINNGKDADTPTEGLPTDSLDTTSEQVPTSDSLTVAISSFSQTNGVVESTAETNNSGTCVFSYVPADGGKPVTKQVTVTDEVCKTSISENEFPYLGNWVLTVTFYNNAEKVEAQKNVSIN